MQRARSPRSRYGPVHCIAFLLILAAVGPAQAQPSPSSTWVAKFVCGRQAGDAWNQVAPGAYYTAINILNRGREAALLNTQIATTTATTAGGVTVPGPTIELRSQQAAEIDCADILKAARSETFLKGFLSLTGAAELTITAVYTAANERDVSAIDVEPIAAASSGSTCPDLTIAPVGRPIPDVAARRTTVRAMVTNIGTAAAPPSKARVEDPNRPGDPLRIAETNVDALPAGANALVDIVLGYAITGSTNLAALLLTVDPKNLIAECREDNNTRTVGAP